MSNIFAVYKPKGPSSASVVREIKKVAGKDKVGHGGTLDPLARGVLVVGIGREATKNLTSIINGGKEYVALIKLGEISTTDDEEGEKTIGEVKIHPDKEEIKKVVDRFIGPINQVPPLFSAIKIKGREAYKLARAGKEVKLSPRSVLVENIEILSYRWPLLKLRVITGPGVYIRSLARDIGEFLGVGGYLFDLERIRVGKFTVQQAISVDKLKKQILKGKI